MKGVIYTIGYTGFTVEEFISTLKKYEINVVIDVRSSPYSERYADYNRDNIESLLSENGIYYRNYVKEFGARQDNRSFYAEEGFLDFEKFAKSEQFLSGVEKIINSVAKGYKIVFLCAEKDPIQCHRTILVARTFHELGYKVVHLLPNNDKKTHAEIINILLSKYDSNFRQCKIFSDNQKSNEEYMEEHIVEAYRKQNKKIGYRKDEEEL